MEFVKNIFRKKNIRNFFLLSNMSSFVNKIYCMENSSCGNQIDMLKETHNEEILYNITYKPNYIDRFLSLEKDNEISYQEKCKTLFKARCIEYLDPKKIILYYFETIHKINEQTMIKHLKNFDNYILDNNKSYCQDFFIYSNNFFRYLSYNNILDHSKGWKLEYLENGYYYLILNGFDLAMSKVLDYKINHRSNDFLGYNKYDTDTTDAYFLK